MRDRQGFPQHHLLPGKRSGRVLALLFLGLLVIATPVTTPAGLAQAGRNQQSEEPAATLVKDIRPGPATSRASDLTNWNGTLFFQADDGVSGSELWKSDGTAEGTILLKDIRQGPVGSNPAQFAEVIVRFDGNVKPLLFFSADDGVSRRELWVSDGTADATFLVRDIRPGPLGGGFLAARQMWKAALADLASARIAAD